MSNSFSWDGSIGPNHKEDSLRMSLIVSKRIISVTGALYSAISLQKPHVIFFRRSRLAWAMFSVPSYDPLNIDQFKEVEDILLQLESLNIKFKPGRNMTISATMLNHNPVKAYPKPFLFYVVMKAFECVEFWALTCFGFDKLAIGEITYWVRNSPNKTSVLKNTHHVPIVFIHGLGVGLLQYIHFVYCLKSSQSSRTIFLVELPYVSMRFVEHVPSVEETVAGIEGLLEFHGFQKAHIVGHSWGTAVVSWMIKYSKYTVSSVLLDPIVFLPITPDLAFNFVHRRPGHNTDTVRANEFIVHWLLSRELHISHVISRHYCWHHNLLWPDELPKYHHVVGSSQDMLINGQMLAKYLETNHVEHTMFDVDHGSFLIMPDIQSDIIALIGRVCDAADPEVSP
ncbi:hypothetical protein BDR26DRAFT_240972 [Obelidium mucronatum]|nr:hypothetical protein BDR26DRAFT_240972 [Obelidium mucronatum]